MSSSSSWPEWRSIRASVNSPRFLSVAVVRLNVDRALEEERFVETVELLLDGLGRRRPFSVA